ncbi:RNA-guided endonuclease InsQ/TnpB family protein [Nocardia pseudovaccinii]|uniref:RNA-guided endonuclease InsQ/TnpB family protein n=1 Tax=Nocardia pseudovaccinii TaxID=189540 RepID=UPI001C3FD42C|nr:RNA-guided endonuclease TnpB family protein [Nocardia pseudovaccinii]
MLTDHRRGESDLVYRGGNWYLYATRDVPEPEPTHPTGGFFGVDLGIANIATTSDGAVHAGKHLNQVRHRNRRLRKRLQQKGTKSAKRLLRKVSGREKRFAADTNHRVSKTIVTEAQRTSRGIALEDLGGIRERVRLRKPQRVTLHSWSFAQLGTYIAYKAKRAGIPVTYVDPGYTSQQCSGCGHTSRKNRPDQATFVCTSCGFAEHADVNAARNIAARAVAGWAVSHAADDATEPTPARCG